ncbi:hypothetical protein EHM69_00975 [candidate division KSB1 bacterium]|nr:MAG: hypothetical protein EHM69_00975 [candidate division KSB1 bacterium]
MQRKNIRPSTTFDGHHTNPWSYFDHQNLALYLNPGLTSGQLLHITSAGSSFLSEMPKTMKFQIDPPTIAAPITLQQANELTARYTPQVLQRDLFSWMTPAHYDCRMAMAWMFSAPLAPWFTDSIQLRFVGSNPRRRKCIMETLSRLLYGHANAVGLSQANPIVLSTTRPELDTLNTVASHGALLATAGTDKMFTGKLQGRTAYLICNPSFETSLISLPPASLAAWRETMLAVQVQVISKLLKRFEDERARMAAQPAKIPYYTFQHGPVLHAIAEEMDAM